MSLTVLKNLDAETRAVVFRLFQETVILPPNPVGFRLTYTQLWDHIFHSICINLLELMTKVFFLQLYLKKKVL